MIRIEENFNLSSRNTFRMKVRCAKFVEYDSAADLAELDFESLPQPILHIGGGSNLLFTDDFFPGTVLHSAIKYVKYVDMGLPELSVAVGAGVVFDDLVAETCRHGLWGLENLSLIPGEVGAAAVQNIGAYGAEVKDTISGVVCFDTLERRKVSFKAGECRYGYRDSIFKDPAVKGRYIVTSVLFRLSREPRPRLDYGPLKALSAEGLNSQTVRDTVIAVRREKLPDPSEKGSAGSFFKNPVVLASQFAEIAKDYETVPHFILDSGFVKVPAAWMIEQCGFKGKTLGGAAVYSKQPLVIVNETGDASPDDVLALESEIISSVLERFGVELSPEVEHI